MSKDKTLTELLREARHAKGLTQAALAKKAHMYANTYAKIERGEQKPSVPSLNKLSEALDIELPILMKAWSKSAAR